MGIDIQPPGPSQETGAGAASKSAHGSITGPGAGAALATVTSGNLQTGTRYQVDAYAYLNGTTASPADDDNIAVLFNGSTIAIVPIDGTPGSIGRPNHVTAITAPANGVNSCTAQAIGAATGTAIYHVTLVATPVGD